MGQQSSLQVHNFHKLLWPWASKAVKGPGLSVWVKMCLPESSKLYTNSLREQNCTSFLSPELTSHTPPQISRGIKRYWEEPTSAREMLSPSCTVHRNCYLFKHLTHTGQSHRRTPVLTFHSITRALHTPGAENTRAHKTGRGNTSPWVSCDYYYGTTPGHQLWRETKMAKATDFRIRECFQ